MTVGVVGMVGLGNMGSVLASNLAESGFTVITHDALGAERSPEGTTFVGNVADVAGRAEVVVLSLPDGAASTQVVQQVVATTNRRVTHIIDTSTVGITAARTCEALLAADSVAYIDAPVSGGVAGARARSLAVMYAGSEAACAHIQPVLAGLSDRHFHIGERPGMAQAMKLVNNFLSATALAATSEAITFGRSVGLDMETMLEVLNGSSGQSAASSDKFPNHVLNERYASGFSNLLMSKDVTLYVSAVEELGSPRMIGQVTSAIWEQFGEAEPGADFTRIFPFVERS